MPGSSIPSAFVLWITRELPPWIAASAQEQATITFSRDGSAAVRRPQQWTLTTNAPVCTCRIIWVLFIMIFVFVLCIFDNYGCFLLISLDVFYLS